MTKNLLGFPAETFARRRAAIRESMQGGVLLLPAASIARRSRDTAYRYRPDSELFYLTGCVDPGVVAVIRDSGKDDFVLFVPPQDETTRLWTGPRPGPEEAKEILGADRSLPLEALEEELPGLLRSGRKLFFRVGIHPELDAMVVAAMRWSRAKGSRTGEGPRVLVDPGALLDWHRMRKDPEEIACIRRAAELTAMGFLEAMREARPGMGEWEIEAIFESTLRSGGALGPAFPTIVGAGENGCTLHYQENRNRVGERELVLLDGGAEVDLYAADVTRTFPASGQFTDLQRQVYERVLGALDAAIQVLRPGAAVEEVHQAAVRELTVGLMELGILKGDLGTLLEEEAFKPFFPHQTSHWLGLDVHDVGDYATDRESLPLVPGMVLTVEPGLYFPRGRGQADHPFSGIGVRLEDDLLVTEEGVENLTESIPVTPEKVEALVQGGGQNVVR
ncbi:MAG: aminopeptidase P N-terminal domain-containing protein [Gemmatimonadota bacterium]|jgi:Xaa-Pro aminopeptidase